MQCCLLPRPRVRCAAPAEALDRCCCAALGRCCSAPARSLSVGAPGGFRVGAEHARGAVRRSMHRAHPPAERLCVPCRSICPFRVLPHAAGNGHLDVCGQEGGGVGTPRHAPPYSRAADTSRDRPARAPELYGPAHRHSRPAAAFASCRCAADRGSGGGRLAGAHQFLVSTDAAAMEAAECSLDGIIDTVRCCSRAVRRKHRHRQLRWSALSKHWSTLSKQLVNPVEALVNPIEALVNPIEALVQPYPSTGQPYRHRQTAGPIPPSQLCPAAAAASLGLRESVVGGSTVPVARSSLSQRRRLG